MSITPLARATAVAATLLSAGLAVAQPRLQPQDFLRLRSVGDVQVSRDGARVAYTVINNDAPGRPYSQLWIMELASGKTVRVGGDSARGGGPVWSPDSARIAFNGRIGEQSGAHRLARGWFGAGVPRADDGHQQQRAPQRRQRHRLVARRRAHRLRERHAWTGDRNADGDPMVIERYLYKPTASEGNTRFNDNRRLHLFVVDLGSRAGHAS